MTQQSIDNSPVPPEVIEEETIPVLRGSINTALGITVLGVISKTVVGSVPLDNGLFQLSINDMVFAAGMLLSTAYLVETIINTAKLAVGMEKRIHDTYKLENYPAYGICYEVGRTAVFAIGANVVISASLYFLK